MIPAPYLFRPRPQHRETFENYSDRIQTANFEGRQHRTELTRTLTQANPTLDEHTAWNTLLQSRTRHNLDRLNLTPHTPAFLHQDGTDCAPCAAALGPRYQCTLCSHGAHIAQRPHVNQFVCIKHHRWTGPGSTPATQHTIGTAHVTAQRQLTKLLRRGRFDATLYLTLTLTLAPLAIGRGTTTHTPAEFLFPRVVEIARLLTNADFTRTFFNPNSTFVLAHAYLGDSLRPLLGEDTEVIARDLWLRYRTVFLRLRESLDEGRLYEPGPAHDLPADPSILNSIAPPTRPLEPIRRYLAASGDRKLTHHTAFDILAPTAKNTAMLKGKIETICFDGHRTTRTNAQILKSALHERDACGVCGHWILRPGINDLATTHPREAKQFHPTRNGNVTASDIFAKTSTTYWWLCEAGHEWPASGSNRIAAGSGCPTCLNRIIILGVNDLATRCPAAGRDWDHTLNCQDINKMAAGSNTVVWWLCPAQHSYRESIGDFTRRGACRECKRLERAPERMLPKARPDIAREWHTSANAPLIPDDFTIGSPKLVMWTCPAGHDYPQRIERRVAGIGCSICSSRRLERGVNDAATRYPKVCTEWHPFLNGLTEPGRILPGTDLYWWRCIAKQHNLRQSIPHRIKSGGCPDCPPEHRVSKPPQR